MCAGPHFSWTFTDCIFDQCTLYAVHGADARLCGCRFMRCTPAVVASGAATVARFTGCLFHTCHTGLVIECGAAALMQDSAILVCMFGLIANGPGSHVDMVHSTAEVKGAAAEVAPLCVVAVVASKGRARLVRCNLNRQQFTVHASGRGTAVEVLESSIASHMRSVIADLSARATMWDVDACTDLRLNMRHRYPGVCSRSMMDHGMLTVQVSDGAVLQALRCHVRGYGSGIMTSTGGCSDVLLTPQEAGGVKGDKGAVDREPQCPTASRFLDAESGLVKGCVFEGAWLAIVADSSKPVHVKDCVARFGAAAPAPFMRVLKRAVVEGCAVAGASLKVLTGSRVSAVVRRCSFGPACVRGVSVTPGGSAEALDCDFNVADAGMGAPMLGAQCPHEGAVARAVMEDVLVVVKPESQ
eukprot:jgi/Ulvmu1/2111/UM126_0003.1